MCGTLRESVDRIEGPLEDSFREFGLPLLVVRFRHLIDSFEFRNWVVMIVNPEIIL